MKPTAQRRGSDIRRGSRRTRENCGAGQRMGEEGSSPTHAHLSAHADAHASDACNRRTQMPDCEHGVGKTRCRASRVEFGLP